MRLRWEYELPVCEQMLGYEYEGPIHPLGDEVCFVTFDHEYPREVRAEDEGKRGRVLHLHRVEIRSGLGRVTSSRVTECLIPSEWTYIQCGRKLLLHTGYVHEISKAAFEALAWPYLRVAGAVASNRRGTFLQDSGRLIFAGRPGTDMGIDDESKWVRSEEGYIIHPMPRGGDVLYCYDLDALINRWELGLEHTPPRDQYRVGPPAFIGDHIVCDGQDALNWIDPDRGEIDGQVRVPRVDKLFAPLEYEGDLLLAYTNWTTGGVMRYSLADRKVVWRYRRRQYAGNARGELIRQGDVVVWSKGGTEIVGLDVGTGEQLWSLETLWLYTGIDPVSDSLIFGTSGRDGSVCRANPRTGEVAWSHFL